MKKEINEEINLTREEVDRFEEDKFNINELNKIFKEEIKNDK